MGITRAGRGSSSRSKNSNSIPVAPREKTLKLTPPPPGVAPRGELRPIVLSQRFMTHQQIHNKLFVYINHRSHLAELNDLLSCGGRKQVHQASDDPGPSRLM